jgi:hypothetical protein
MNTYIMYIDRTPILVPIYRLLSFHVPNLMSLSIAYIISQDQSRPEAHVSSSYDEKLLATLPTPKLEDHPL